MVETEKIQDIGSITVSASVLGKMIGVTSDRRVRALAQEGIFVKASQGRYKLQESIYNYILNLKVANEAGNSMSNLDDEPDLDIEKAKHERVKRHIDELKLALMRGDVHKSSDVEAVMMDMLTKFKMKCLSIPSKLTPILEEKDKEFILETLTDEMNDLLNELSGYNAESFYGKEYISSEEELENESE